MDTPRNAPVPPQLPGFMAVRELGRGASAVVWLAKRERDGCLFAVKCLNGVAAEEELRREVRILERLDHGHLVTIHDVLKVSDVGESGLGLVLDYAPGGSLAQVLASRGRLSVGETVTVLTPLAQSLAYLHGQGVTHADVSPGNVLFTAHGKPLLADLGIGRMVGDPDRDAGTGTPGFRAPASGHDQHSGLRPERDVYSLAALGWYCLTGSAPDIAPRRPPLSLAVPDVPAGLAAAIEAGLDQEGRNRPSAAELATAVFRSAAPEAVDLTASAHTTVLPDLLTRGHDSVQRRILPAWLSGVSRRGVARRRHPATPKGSKGRDSRHRRSARRTRLLFALAAVMTAAVAVAALTQTWLPRQETTGAQASGTAVAQATPGDGLPQEKQRQLRSSDAVEAFRALSGLRDTALSQGRLEFLDQVNAAGSSAAAADAVIRSKMTERGVMLAGFSTTLEDVTLEPGSGPDRAIVAVTVSTSAYEERDASGTSHSARFPGERQRLRIALVRTEGLWHIAEILPPEGA